MYSDCKEAANCVILTDMKKSGGEVIEILDETDACSYTPGAIWLHFYYTSGGDGASGLVAAKPIWSGNLDHADLPAVGSYDLFCRRFAVLPQSHAAGEAKSGSRRTKEKTGGILQTRLMGGML